MPDHESEPELPRGVPVGLTSARLLSIDVESSSAATEPWTHAGGSDYLYLAVSAGSDSGVWGPLSNFVAPIALKMACLAVAERWQDVPAGIAARARRASRHGHTGLALVSAAAVELALWDLCGQREQLPVWQLWAHSSASAPGPTQCYATCFGLQPNQSGPTGLIDRLAAFPVHKWQPIDNVQWLDFIRLCEALPDCKPAIDFLARWPLAAAMEYCRDLPLELAWVEEPSPAGQIAELRGWTLPIPLAGGERCYTPDEAEQLLAVGHRVLQFDPTFCSLDRYLSFSRRALATGAVLAPHGAGLLPALHVSAASNLPILAEYHLALEPRRQAHYQSPLAPDDHGRIAVPCLPGWNGPTQCLN